MCLSQIIYRYNCFFAKDVLIKTNCLWPWMKLLQLPSTSREIQQFARNVMPLIIMNMNHCIVIAKKKHIRSITHIVNSQSFDKANNDDRQDLNVYFNTIWVCSDADQKFGRFNYR